MSKRNPFFSSTAATVLLAAAGARGTAKTHLPTDEASLKQLQLATGHELPGLVLEYRCGRGVCYCQWMIRQRSRG